MTAAQGINLGMLSGRGWLFWLSSSLLAVLSVFLIWLFFFVPWRSIELDQGLGTRALRFPYLAAQEYLSRQGIESQQIRGLDVLSGEGGYADFAVDDTLLLIDSYRALSQAAAMELLAWVSEGGHVILSSRNPFLEELDASPGAGSDPVFESVGYRSALASSAAYFPYSAYRESIDRIVPPVDADSESALPESQGEEARTLEDLLADLDENPESALASQIAVFRAESCFDGVPTSEIANNAFENLTSENAAAQFLGNRFLQQRSEIGTGGSAVRAGDERGAQIVSMNFGQGRVTLTTDNHLWSNYRIGCYDHAYLLSALTQDSGKVWIVLNETSASLAAVLWRSFSVALSLLGLVLVLWIWNQLARFGPIFETDNRIRRSLMEHIDASAGFLYRKKLTASLLEDLLAQIELRCERLYRGYSNLPSGDRARILADHTQLALAEIEQLLNLDSAAQSSLSEAEFVKRVELCQKIRKTL